MLATTLVIIAIIELIARGRYWTFSKSVQLYDGNGRSQVLFLWKNQIIIVYYLKNHILVYLVWPKFDKIIFIAHPIISNLIGSFKPS